MSISLNGSLHGYFSCKRDVSHGDPLFPIIFYFVDEVHNRSFSKLVNDGALIPMKATRLLDIPSHVVYVDNILILYQGKS